MYIMCIYVDAIIAAASRVRQTPSVVRSECGSLDYLQTHHHSNEIAC